LNKILLPVENTQQAHFPCVFTFPALLHASFLHIPVSGTKKTKEQA
jgi:hypothetical protein